MEVHPLYKDCRVRNEVDKMLLEVFYFVNDFAKLKLQLPEADDAVEAHKKNVEDANKD